MSKEVGVKALTFPNSKIADKPENVKPRSLD